MNRRWRHYSKNGVILCGSSSSSLRKICTTQIATEHETSTCCRNAEASLNKIPDSVDQFQQTEVNGTSNTKTPHPTREMAAKGSHSTYPT